MRRLVPARATRSCRPSARHVRLQSRVRPSASRPPSARATTCRCSTSSSPPRRLRAPWCSGVSERRRTPRRWRGDGCGERALARVGRAVHGAGRAAPHDLESLDLFVCEAALGVAENGAVWMATSDSLPPRRALSRGSRRHRRRERFDRGGPARRLQPYRREGTFVRRIHRRPIEDGRHRAVARGRRARTQGADGDRRRPDRSTMKRRDFLQASTRRLALGAVAPALLDASAACGVQTSDPPQRRGPPKRSIAVRASRDTRRWCGCSKPSRR